MNNLPQYNISDEEWELIENYLQQQLDAPTQARVEERLRTDIVFKQKVQELQQIFTGISEVALKSRLDAFHEATKSVQPAGKVVPLYKKATSYRWWVAASVAVVVISAAWWLWTGGNSDEKLFATYFKTDIGLPVAMGSADSAAYIFNDGMISYKQGDYKAAIAAWDPLTQTRYFSDTLQYYIAMAWLNQQDWQKAQAFLQPIVENGATVFHDDAIWYMALIHLQSGDRQAARILLKHIPQRAEAKKLLSDLGSPGQ